MHQLMNALKIRKDIVKLLIGIRNSFRYSYIAKNKVIELTDQQRLELEAWQQASGKEVSDSTFRTFLSALARDIDV